MKMNISEVLLAWLFKKKTEAVACFDSRPLPAVAVADADEISAAKDYRNSLKEHKKLCLVINLDNVLIDSIDLCDLTGYDVYYFSNSGVQNMSLKYEIVLYSKRSPAYVDHIHKLLDPDGTINLTLKFFLSNPDLLVILDDTGKGWDNKYCSNLIKVAPYPYFNRANMKNKSWTKLKGDECEKGGELYRICHRLGSLHTVIYDPNFRLQDARQVIQEFRSNNCLDNFHL
ncbi:RNA polymerase II C-terminal domain phosphatase-like 4, partial [Bienertia sinuspersici]